MLLNIKNLHVSIGGKEILKGLNLGVNEGEIHAIMGPNGTGKSTLAAAITGREGYEITEGEIWYKGKLEFSISSGDPWREHPELHAHCRQLQTRISRPSCLVHHRLHEEDEGEAGHGGDHRKAAEPLCQCWLLRR